MGRPRTFTNTEELEAAVQSYLVDNERPTITGLALALGFESRQSFYDYAENEEFSYTIKKARLKIESEYEKQLYNNGCSGAIFALKNFGWKDKSDIEHTGGLTMVWNETLNDGADNETNQSS